MKEGLATEITERVTVHVMRELTLELNRQFQQQAAMWEHLQISAEAARRDEYDRAQKAALLTAQSKSKTTPAKRKEAEQTRTKPSQSTKRKQPPKIQAKQNRQKKTRATSKVNRISCPTF